MSVQVIHETVIKKARRDHRCGACEFLSDDYRFGTWTFAEMRLIIKAKQDGWKIKKGQSYIRQYNTESGEVWTFKCRPEIHQICIKHDLYPEN